MTRRLTVLEPGPLTTVQDRGRPGLAHLGVPRSGWLDRPAAELANRLVGNDPGAALLETTLGGVSLRVSAAMAVAVTGADCPVLVDGALRAHGAPLSLPAGARVVVGPARAGVRSYVAIAGGVQVPPVLGSRSTDLLSGLGPPPLHAGDELPVGPAQGVPAAVDVPVARASWSGRLADVGRAVTLRCLLGPRVEWFADSAVDRLATSTYEVAADSNRVALRLAGEGLERRRGGELPSEGVVLGAVQVPASGQPLVFLNDHPTTGGYPVVAVVDADDLAACGQLRPGDRVRFRPRREGARG